MLSLLSVSALAAGLGSSGCYGGFALTRKLYAFNSEISGKWVRWLVFLLFYMFFVYGFAALIDGLILNSVEFWTGKRPLSSTQVHQDKDRKAVASAQDENTVVIDMHRGKAKVARVTMTRFEDAILLESDGQRFYVRDAQGGKDETEIVDAQGKALAQLSAREWARTQAAMEQGQGSADALAQVWMDQGPVTI